MISIVAQNAESVNAWDSPSTEIIARRGVLAFRAPRSLGSPKGFQGFAAFLHVSNGDLLSSTLSVLFMQILVEMLNRSLTGPCCTTACFRHVWTQHPPRALSFRLQQRRAYCNGTEDDSNGLHDAELPEELQGALSPSPAYTSEQFPQHRERIVWEGTRGNEGEPDVARDQCVPALLEAEAFTLYGIDRAKSQSNFRMFYLNLHMCCRSAHQQGWARPHRQQDWRHSECLWSHAL